jgi:hypothetical protein
MAISAKNIAIIAKKKIKLFKLLESSMMLNYNSAKNIRNFN